MPPRTPCVSVHDEFLFAARFVILKTEDRSTSPQQLRKFIEFVKKHYAKWTDTAPYKDTQGKVISYQALELGLKSDGHYVSFCLCVRTPDRPRPGPLHLMLNAHQSSRPPDIDLLWSGPRPETVDYHKCAEDELPDAPGHFGIHLMPPRTSCVCVCA